ncbi:ESX secretion-associated protein EspG [Rhodococcus spelaei]|uniref:ESX secretion-associated protein EspG n=1 Tax=Rhodococcus spelaei TaxID=2546320 RepID=A0A541AZW9_9NOCA|nr:ESX secretion-associated protein EspG [Rhodococcus spelaei]TQF65594.1 ESX secretion-associated protein EspG [Rhodococcus spelaei]
MSAVRWTLTPDEFDHAWRETGLDRYPYPLRVRPTARTVDERVAQVRALSDWYACYRDDELAAALAVLAKPAVRVEVFGIEGRHAAQIRVLGCASGRTAVVVAQRPGPSSDVGGDLAMCLAGVDTFAHRIVDMFPASEAGTREAVAAPLAEVRGESRSALMVPVRSATAIARARSLLALPRTGTGEVTVCAGLDRPESSSRSFGWIDVEGDGRYLVRTESAVEIRPLSVADFASELRAELAEPA